MPNLLHPTNLLCHKIPITTIASTKAMLLEVEVVKSNSVQTHMITYFL